MSWTARPATEATMAVRAARDVLLAHATDYDGAVAAVRWPALTEFNFALEWFDVVAGEHPDRAAVTIVDADRVDRLLLIDALRVDRREGHGVGIVRLRCLRFLEPARKEGERLIGLGEVTGR